MKTTLDLPDDLLAELKARAARAGRDLEEFAARLLADALRSTAAPSQAKGDVPAAAQPVPKTLPVANARPAAAAGDAARVTISTDPETGLPVIHSPPDAPIHSMSNDQILALIQDAQLEEDLERAGLPVRH